MSGRVGYGVHCEHTRRVLRAALDAGWNWEGHTRGGHIAISWPATGVLVHTGTTPSQNAWKAFAREIEQVSGVTVWRRGNRRASRGPTSDPDRAEIAASRRRHREQTERRAAALAAAERDRARRATSAARSAADDRRVADVLSLMRPGRAR